MRLVVGCPVINRGWILDHWFDHVETSCQEAGIIPEYAFVLGTSTDNTGEIIERRTQDRSSSLFIAQFGTDIPLPDNIDRSWTVERLEFMTRTRNYLLEIVRKQAPDLFLSLDSDILIHRDTVKNLIESAKEFDAVAGHAYLHSSDLIVNWGRWIYPDKRMRRAQDQLGAVFPTEIIMAVKMMNPSAYNINYEYNFKGEDLGWSWAVVKEHGLSLGVDTRTLNKHCLNRGMLTRVDPRLGV